MGDSRIGGEESCKCVELYSMKFFTIIQLVDQRWKLIERINMVKTEGDRKYQLSNNYTSFIEWIRWTLA